MSETAIRVEGLGKRYRIGTRPPYYSLRESLTQGITAPIGRIVDFLRSENGWKEGIGHNGSRSGAPDKLSGPSGMCLLRLSGDRLSV